MPTAYSYLRFSSAVQASGDSVRRQTAATASWCARNSVTLDTALRMRDEGVSAFRGKNREDGTAALANFIGLVEAGKIARGSYLVVESLDRLSREAIRPALTLLLRLIGDGIRVVQLTPVEAVYDDKVEPMQLMLAIMELSRGHSESAVKSERVGAVWAHKQRNAASRPVTRRTPTWLRAVGGAGKKMKDCAPDEVRFELIEERAAVVRRIFALAGDGYGQKNIAQRLNAENVKPFARSARWTGSLVYQILRSRATVGEYAPYTHQYEGRPPKGDPVPGYFPAVVSEDTYQRAAAAVALRKKVGKGRRGRHVNLFSGLLHDAREGGGTITYWHAGARPANLVPFLAKEGAGPPWVSFPADAFEQGVLSQLRELTAAEVLDRAPAASAVGELQTKLTQTDALIATWTEKMSDLAIVNIVAGKLSELSAQRAALKRELDRLKTESAGALGEAWGEFRSLADVARGGDDETRLKVRAALRRTITRVDCLFVAVHKRCKCAAVVVRFAGTSSARVYLLLSRWGRPVEVQSGLVEWTGPDGFTEPGRAFAEARLRGWASA